MEKKRTDILKEAEENVIAVGIVIMFIMETLNVICKFFIPGLNGVPEEISVFAYIWVCFFCASYCTKRGANIVVDAIVSHYPKKIQNYLFTLQYVVDMILTVLFIIGSVQFDYRTMLEGKTGVTGIPLWIIYLAPLVGFSFNFVRDVQMFIKTIKSPEKVLV